MGNPAQLKGPVRERVSPSRFPRAVVSQDGIGVKYGKSVLQSSQCGLSDTEGVSCSRPAQSFSTVTCMGRSPESEMVCRVLWPLHHRFLLSSCTFWQPACLVEGVL